MGALNRDKLRALITERETTPRAVSRAVGDNPYLVRDILSGKSQNPRSDTMSRIANFLGVNVDELMIDDPGEAVSNPERRFQIAPRFLPVRFRVQAGLWYENDAEEPLVQISHAVVPDPRFANWPQWLELVCGDSANLKIAAGKYAHVVDAIEMGYAPRDGDWVVVERCRGATRERTIKQVEKKNGDVKLWPRSTNPKWKEPVEITHGANDGEELEARIVGLVIGAYDPDF